MVNRSLIHLFVIVSFIILFTSPAQAQRIGVEYGISGAQNYGEPERTYGISLILPVSDKSEVILSYHHWLGEDDNYTFDKNYNRQIFSYPGSYYGNKAFNLLVNYNYYSSGDFSMFAGLGFSSYEMLERDNNELVRSKYIGALTVVPVYLKYNLTGRVQIYSKGILSAKITRMIPDWGSLTFGLEFAPF